MFQVALSNSEPCFPYNVHCSAYHLFLCSKRLFQFKPLRLGEFSLHHALHVMGSDVELPAQNSILSEGYIPLLNLNRQLNRPVIGEKNRLFPILQPASDDFRTGLFRTF